MVLLDLDLGLFGDGVRLIEPDRSLRAPTSSWSPARPTGPGGARRCGAGARKVLSKSQPLRDILATVRRIIAGLPVMDREEREELLTEWARQRVEAQGLRERLDQLTVRESEVLGHLMKGRAVREIAGLSVVSEATVRTQVKSILAKLEVSSQLAAVGMAHEIGWRAPVGLSSAVEPLLGLGQPERQQRLDGVGGAVHLERQLLALGRSSSSTAGSRPGPAGPAAGRRRPGPGRSRRCRARTGSSAARCGRCRRRRT